MKRFYKVLLGTESSASPGLHYKVNGITIADTWNPEGVNPVDMGGFSIATDKALIRWIFRGNILYDVTIPDDAQIVYPPHQQVNGELARVNKIILTNPRPVTDEVALWLYRNSKFEHKEYYEILAGCAICGYKKTCEEIYKDHITAENAAECVNTWANFITPERCSFSGDKELYYIFLKRIQNLANDYKAICP